MTLIIRFTATCALVVGVEACSLNRSNVPENFSEFKAQSAQADARQAAGLDVLMQMTTGGLHPIETVAFSKAPRPKGGPGWQCYEKRKRPTKENGGVCTQSVQECRATASACLRTLAECQSAAQTDAQTEKWDIGSCHSQTDAVCQYIWNTETDGNHACFATAPDCVPYVMGLAVRQSECGTTQ